MSSAGPKAGTRSDRPEETPDMRSSLGSLDLFDDLFESIAVNLLLFSKALNGSNEKGSRSIRAGKVGELDCVGSRSR